MIRKPRIAYQEGKVLYPEAFLKRIYDNNWEQLMGYLSSERDKLIKKAKNGTN